MSEHKKAKPVKAWAIMIGNELARIHVSDHRWHIYDRRDAARINARANGGKYGVQGMRIARVEIKESK